MTENAEDILYAPISNSKEVADEQPSTCASWAFSSEEINAPLYPPSPPPPPPCPPAATPKWVSHGVDADPEWLPVSGQTLVPNGGMRVPGAHFDREAMMKYEVERLRAQTQKIVNDLEYAKKLKDSYVVVYGSEYKPSDWITVGGGSSNTGTISNE